TCKKAPCFNSFPAVNKRSFFSPSSSYPARLYSYRVISSSSISCFSPASATFTKYLVEGIVCNGGGGHPPSTNTSKHILQINSFFILDPSFSMVSVVPCDYMYDRT